MEPPSPPFGAEASRRPPTLVMPCAKSEARTILPDFPSNVCASMTPELFTTAVVRLSAALAVISTRPPSAVIKPLFDASALTAPSSIT